jgi:D-xylose transport system permease protein
MKGRNDMNVGFNNHSPTNPTVNSSWIARLSRRARGEWGALPVILGLVCIWIVFQIANPNFLTPLNLTNLMLQITAVGTISAGLILVLLLGEVDLSAGAVSGLCAATMAVLNVKNDVPGPLAVFIALGIGLGIGLLQGVWITKLRLPSFVVTLAGLLIWQGALLFVLGNTGTVNLTDPFILGLAGTFFSPLSGWGIGLCAVALYLAALFWQRRQLGEVGINTSALRETILRGALVVTGALGSISLLNANRGLPLAVVIFVSVILLFDIITKHTVFGLHIFAVGSNAEAAWRLSINVETVRIAAFGCASLLAALGGILAASRLLAVNQSSGSSDLLLNAMAVAAIGGTSLFGGRGTLWAALIGALVIGSISNGMDLLALASPLKSVITGGVLLFAVTVDAIAHQRRELNERSTG